MTQPDPRRTVPLHVGIIMDGNGRWATQRGLPRSEGHRRGLETAKEIVLAASKAGIRYLSLYAFSTENWKRTVEEVGFLMGLIKRHLRSELVFYKANGIRIVHSGNLDGLPSDICEDLAKIQAETAHFPGMALNLAINYGGRDEIVRAVGRLLENRSREAARIDEEDLAGALDRPDLPDPDLIIRTGGERRLSNFLLWESAYSELYFSDALWPDFSSGDLGAAIADFGRRERRFGGLR